MNKIIPFLDENDTLNEEQMQEAKATLLELIADLEGLMASLMKDANPQDGVDTALAELAKEWQDAQNFLEEAQKQAKESIKKRIHKFINNPNLKRWAYDYNVALHHMLWMFMSPSLRPRSRIKRVWSFLARNPFTPTAQLDTDMFGYDSIQQCTFYGFDSYYKFRNEDLFNPPEEVFSPAEYPMRTDVEYFPPGIGITMGLDEILDRTEDFDAIFSSEIAEKNARLEAFDALGAKYYPQIEFPEG